MIHKYKYYGPLVVVVICFYSRLLTMDLLQQLMEAKESRPFKVESIALKIPSMCIVQF
jgi:hypothetical protein